MVIVQWMLLIVPLIFMKKYKDKLEDYGFSKKSIHKQIFIGIAIAAAIK